MENEKKPNRDPRMEMPPGHFLQDTDWLPEQEGPTNFFSLRDTMFFVFLVASCFVVATVLWLKPPKYISFDENLHKEYDPAVAAKNLPSSLKIHPSYDSRRFEEVPDDDPSVTGDETDLPLKETDEEPAKPNMIKSELKKFFDFLLASLRLRFVA